MDSLPVTIAVGLVTVLLLPDAVASWSDSVWQLRQQLRRNFLPSKESFLGNPLVRLVAWCLRKCCCGRLSSRCRPPHSLRAQAIGRSDLLLWWTSTLPDNPFHDEECICAWRVAPAGTSKDASEKEKAASKAGPSEEDAASPEPDAWKEVPLEGSTFNDPDEGGPTGHRNCALIRELPRGATVQLRACAVNRHGRSEWSLEEIEVDLPRAEKRITERQFEQGVGRSRVVNSGPICVQCRVPQRCKAEGAHFAEVVCKPVSGSQSCKHGPFCERCFKRISAQVLQSCVCRGLIDSWRAVQ